MGEQRDKLDKSATFDVENMLGDPKEMNATVDNDRLAGVIPDPRLPVPPKGGSLEHGQEGESGDRER